MTLTLRTGRGLLKYERHHLVYVADVTYVDGIWPVSVIASELWLSSIAILMTSDNFKVRRTEHKAFKFVFLIGLFATKSQRESHYI